MTSTPQIGAAWQLKRLLIRPCRAYFFRKNSRYAPADAKIATTRAASAIEYVIAVALPGLEAEDGIEAAMSTICRIGGFGAGETVVLADAPSASIL